MLLASDAGCGVRPSAARSGPCQASSSSVNTRPSAEQATGRPKPRGAECDVCCGSRSSIAPRQSGSAATRRRWRGDPSSCQSFGVPLLPSVEGASGAVGRLRRSVVCRRSESTKTAPQTFDRSSVTTSVMCENRERPNAFSKSQRAVVASEAPRRVHFRVRCAPECSPSPLSPRHSRGRRRPACTPRCRASRTRARIPSTVVISTLVSRLRAAARCQPKPNPKPNPNPNRNPNNPNPDPDPDPKQVLALHLHHGARLGAHAAHDLVQRRTWRAEHVRPLPGVRPLHPD